MELEENKQEYIRIQRKVKHIRISRRDTAVNDLKNSTAEGIISFFLSLVSVLVMLLAFYISYRHKGNASAFLGCLPLVALCISIASVILAVMGLKRRAKIRHYMERRGIILSVLMILMIIGLYIYGLTVFLN